MPAIPHSVSEKIRRGEFIHLDQLLPNNVPSEVTTSYSLSLDSNNTNSTPRICVSNSLQNTKNKIFDLFTWQLTWTLFCQAFLIFNADFAQQLIKYQLFIAQLASSYNFQAWYSYDQAFRLFLAINPEQRSLENWLSLGKEALVLYCNAVNLPPSGSVADFLYEHYSCEDQPTSTSLENPVIQVSSVPASTTLSVRQPASLFDTTTISMAPHHVNRYVFWPYFIRNNPAKSLIGHRKPLFDISLTS